jgi:hypothetical protein
LSLPDMARKAKAEPKTAADPTSHGMSEEDFDPEEVEAHRRATAEREEVWTTRDAERMAVRANMVGEARTIGCRVETVTLFDGDGRLLMMLNRPTWTRMTPRCQLDRRLAENITSSNHSGRRRTTVTRRSRRMATSAQQQKQWSDGVGPRLNALPNILDYTCYSNNLDRTARKASHTSRQSTCPRYLTQWPTASKPFFRPLFHDVFCSSDALQSSASFRQVQLYRPCQDCNDDGQAQFAIRAGSQHELWFNSPCDTLDSPRRRFIGTRLSPFIQQFVLFARMRLMHVVQE